MFRINQLEQENGFLMQQTMACESTLQLWMEDHKRVTKENQDLKRREKQWKSNMEEAHCWMEKMHEKHKYQEEKSKFLEEESSMKDHLIRTMREEMNQQQQEMKRLA